MLEMLIVNEREKHECFKKIVYLDSSRLSEIVKIYSPQIEGNKDCEVLICVDFYHSGPSSRIIELEDVDKIDHVRGLKICRSPTP